MERIISLLNVLSGALEALRLYELANSLDIAIEAVSAEWAETMARLAGLTA
jgi:hypothetical protein